VLRFLALLRAALASACAHVADWQGRAPPSAELWAGGANHPVDGGLQRRSIGWVAAMSYSSTGRQLSHRPQVAGRHPLLSASRRSGISCTTQTISDRRRGPPDVLVASHA